VTLAAQTGAELWLLRALTVPLTPSAPDMVACSTLALDNLMYANEHVLACAVARAEDADVPCTAMARWGAVPYVIMQTAEEADCDVLVVGAPACPGWPHIPQRLGAMMRSSGRRMVGSTPSWR